MANKIVIIGTGFAGVWSALSARSLIDQANKASEFEILVVAPEPVLVMRPRLYESNASSLVHSLDALFQAADIKFIPGTVQAIHPDAQTIAVRPTSGTASSITITYNRVILAAGSSVIRPDSVPGLQQHAFDIDSLASAIKLEAHLEGLASRPASPSRDTVVVCGAGFTGIELAAELPKRLQHLANPRIILVDNAPELGATLGAGPRPTITAALDALGVETKLGSGIAAVDPSGVTLSSGERIQTNTAIWTAGVKATPLTQQIPGPRDRFSRLHVDPYLRVPSAKGVFASGDAAAALADGKRNYALMSCQHALLLGRVSGYNAAAELLGQPLVEYSQPAYNCCLDLGPWGAVVAGGWDEKRVKVSGDLAKRVKMRINQELIYPPAGLEDALALAGPVQPDSDRLFEQLIRVVG
ncbi:NAD(P)/FAD-dependent oxidoreductase [Aspergillus candidus]|uniref:Pyridine nucleotide-disulfide oxidoreductase family protein n=1 Tax=Aspergillus candidus TaxID=41067 RepID=A0A2I2F7M9_ASPCN|nr:pyridine nucleotide-disulfide oxidoreductase family protein [Aspergillus candidus]PLB36634.1 pyridine nucleotide-disulfide oxidoreductase family protein [Aspergillus candidus]